MDRRFEAASVVMQALHRTVVVKNEFSHKAKLSIYHFVYILTFADTNGQNELRSSDILRAAIALGSKIAN